MKIKKVVLIAAVVLLCGALSGLAGAEPATIDYGDVPLSGGFVAGNFDEVWDLTKCDLIITFTYDGNGLSDDARAHAWSQLGARTVGYGNFNPTEGAGVWMATDYHYTAGTFDPDPEGAPALDLDDKLHLQKVGGQGEGAYNLPGVPAAPGNNHRFWFDRDGVDQWQAQSPLAVDGGTYNTGGTYEIQIVLTATSETSGEAFMTINALDQGFETDGDWRTIELTPAGMTFTGEMAKLQIFYGLYGYGATHGVSFNNVTVEGCLRDPVSIDGCETGVTDVVYNGKLLSDLIDECAEGAANHGQFVKCVSSLTNQLKASGIISGKEKGAIVSCAARAAIP
ncbi:exported hypothetical protein [uncultured Desulfatiglans sp.]|uniref:Uncharacterized protein n=1 Tax=Uncultured Desulfatiglans sp. TaxID=1748965 RepID=A0A653A1H6_UNCDX|nr:exported hypothetical protein [uncultured Desulfatiglans sp.]